MFSQNDFNSLVGLIWNNWPISIGITGTIFWLMFFVRSTLAHGYRAYAAPYWKPTAVVAVNYREQEDVVRASINSVMSGAKKPDLFVMVFNGKPIGYERGLGNEYTARYGAQMVFIYRDTPGKRPAQVNGIKTILEHNQGLSAERKIEHIVLMDGDALWGETTLVELVKPFIDNRIDAVAAAQEFLNPDQSLWTHITSLLVFWGHHIGQKWQSAKFCSSCLRGRTNAFRTEVLAQEGFLEEFEHWALWGQIPRISGDDGSLTFLTLKYNWLNKQKRGGTFIQMSSLIYTLAEPSFQKFYKMRVRCVGNTTSRYLDAITQPWFWHQNWRFKVEFINSVVVPLGFALCTWAFLANIWQAIQVFYWWGEYTGFLIPLAMFTWFMLGRLIRSFGWAEQKWVRIARWPLMILVFLFPLVIARWHGTFSIFRPQTSWGTRTQTSKAVSFAESARVLRPIAGQQTPFLVHQAHQTSVLAQQEVSIR